MKKFFSLLAAALFAVSAFGVTATSPETVDAAGLCVQSQQTSDQMYIRKRIQDISGSPSYFDGVRGDATMRVLDTCDGIFASSGNSAVLPANVQDGSGHIYQLGWSTNAYASSNFTYVDGDTIGRTVPASIYGDCVWRVGNRVRFTISKSGSHAQFQIQDLTAGCGFFWTGTTSWWGSAMDLAWWGYEKNDQNSGLGSVQHTGNINMAYMGYNTNLNSTWTFRSGLNDTIKKYYDNSCENCVFWNGPYPGDSKVYETFIGTWAYTGDKFNVITHY